MSDEIHHEKDENDKKFLFKSHTAHLVRWLTTMMQSLDSEKFQTHHCIVALFFFIHSLIFGSTYSVVVSC